MEEKTSYTSIFSVFYHTSWNLLISNLHYPEYTVRNSLSFGVKSSHIFKSASENGIQPKDSSRR